MTDGLIKFLWRSGGGSAAVLAVKGLPPQQQLLLCAAANLIGDASANSVLTPLKGTPSRRLSGLGCSTPMSASNKVMPCSHLSLQVLQIETQR